MEAKKTILLRVTSALKTDLLNSMQSKGRNATGATAKAINDYAPNDDVSILDAPEYIDALEYGRKPTRPGAPKSDPSLFDRIKVWCDAKGIEAGAAYAITKNIHKNGYPGKPGVLTEPLGEANVNKRVDEQLGALADIIATQLADSLHI